MAAVSAAINTPGTIWGALIEQNASKAKRPDGKADTFVYFVGQRGCGKSTLLNAFLYPTRVEVPKPSHGLEYTFAKKPSTYDHEKKDVAHIWEIGGSKQFAEEVVSGDHLFLSFKQVSTAVVVVSIDLSDPGSAVSSAVEWMDLIKKKLAATYTIFEKKGLQLPEQLRQRSKRLYGQNEDKDLVSHSGVSIVLVATKYDVFQEQEPELKKVIARALRCVAHCNGAHLVYLGGLQPVTSTSKPFALQKDLLEAFSKLMNHLLFAGLDKKPSVKLRPLLDHLGPLFVPAGTDSFKAIGRPRGGSADTDAASLQAEWLACAREAFPAKAQEEGGGRFSQQDKYKESDVDGTMERLMENLARYQKEQAALKKEEMLRKKNLQAKQAAVQKPAANSSQRKKPAAKADA